MKNSETNFENQIPFKKDFVESEDLVEYKGKLFEFENDPEKIVRIACYRKDEGGMNCIDTAVLGNKLYRELENSYSISAPVEYLVGKSDKDKKVIYGVTDKVNGKNLEEVEVTTEIIEQVKDLYNKIAQYYLDKLINNEPYLVDINAAPQYVYGKRKDDTKESIYLIDTDLYIHYKTIALYNTVLWTVKHFLMVENRFNEKFDKTRGIIEEILDKPLSDGIEKKEKRKISKIIKKTKEYLKGIFPKKDKNYHPIFSNFDL